MPERTYLKIPFVEKDRVRADITPERIYWDADKKQWYYAGDPKKMPSLLNRYVGVQEFVLSVPFMLREYAMAQGVRWNPNWRVSTWSGHTLPPTLTHYAAKPYSWEAYVENELNNSKGASKQAPKAITLMPHQLQAVQTIELCYQKGLPGFLQ